MSMELADGSIEERLLHETVPLPQLLDRVRSRISCQLIGDRQWERLLERAHELPADMAASLFGFEFPLHTIQPEADLGVAVARGSRSAAFFEQRGRSQDTDPTIAAIAHILAETASDAAPLRRLTSREMMLEYEIDSTLRGAHPPAGIFLYARDQVLAGDRSNERLRDLGIVADAVVAAVGWDPDAAERSQLEQVFLAMEPETWIRSVGAFPARERALRLAVNGFRTREGIIRLLECVGWPGQAATVVAEVSGLEGRGAVACTAAHLDVRASGVGPRLGLTLSATDENRPSAIHAWRELLAALGGQCLAVPEKLSALADAWSGAEMLLGRSGLFVLRRGVHHVKFVATGDRLEQVKAYCFVALTRAKPQTARAAR